MSLASRGALHGFSTESFGAAASVDLKIRVESGERNPES